jgi:hypothetical protein
MTQTLIKNTQKFQVLTDEGWSNFDGVLSKGRKQLAEIKLQNLIIKATLNHKLYTKNLNTVLVKELRPGIAIKTSKGYQKVVSVTLGEYDDVFDLLNVEKNHRFFANDILCANCRFIIDAETLINPLTLASLTGIEPIGKMGQVRWFRKIIKGHTYVITLDPSLGTGGDNAAIQIFDGNTTEQIGEWKHNKTDIPNQIKLLKQINEHIAEQTSEPNNIYYSLENNSIGEAALVSLHEFGEQNIPGSFISEAGKKRKGFTVTQKTKLAACAKLKTLLERGRLVVHSKSLISELKNFISHAGSYAAKIGETDDLVMSTLLAIRVIQEVGSYNLELDNQVRDHEEIIMPLPFFAVFN